MGTRKPAPKPRVKAPPKRGPVEPKLLYSVAESARLLSLSERKVYYMLARGDIGFSVKTGNRRLIPAWVLEQFAGVRSA